MGNWNLDSSPVYLLLDLLGRVASPYELNPLNLNPLRDLLESMIDFEQVRACPHLKIYVSATNVETRSEEHTSELQSLMRISYAVFCLKKKKQTQLNTIAHNRQT